MSGFLFLSIGIAAPLLGVNTKTLRRWESSGKLKPAFQTPGNHRRYKKTRILSFGNHSAGLKRNSFKKAGKRVQPKAVLYRKASSSRQKASDDLERQFTRLKASCKKKVYKIINTCLYASI